MAFELRSFQQILADMLSKVIAETPLTDISPGSVMSTLLEAASQEDFQQYYQMLQIIRNYNLDTTEGDDLDERATEYSLTRIEAQKATGDITISDSAITKISTKIYAGLAGPVAGQTFVYADDTSAFDSSGSIIIGRNTDNVETVAYSSITSFTNYYRFNLSAGLSNDHGTDETIILSQGGDRVIAAGTVVKIPASDINEEITYSLDNEATILDGEEEITNVAVTSDDSGEETNAPVGAINTFDSLPFSTAEVTNPSAFTNGADEESDEELRDRIKEYIQSLSKGTTNSIINEVVGITDISTNKRVVSANLVDVTTLNDIVKLYIDDGTGFESSFEGQGQETVIDSATGGEQFLQLDLFPVVKAQIENLNSEPYTVQSGDTLIYKVNNVEETITFSGSDFSILESGTAEEIVTAINDRATLIEARTFENASKVVINAIADSNETIQITGGTANTSTKLNFPTDIIETLYLYKDDGTSISLLNKDGSAAYIECNNTAPYDFTTIAGFPGAPATMNVIIDGKNNTQTVSFQNGDFASNNAATAAEVAARINLDLSGAIASATSSNTKVTITSNLENSSNSKVKINAGDVTTLLGFDTSEVTGSDKDYTLNRFNGQIELENPLTVEDQITAGSTSTRAFIISGVSQTYDLDNGDTIDIKVDGGGAQTATFNTADFSDIDNATAQEVVDVLNEDIKGMTASVTSDNKIKIRTNTYAQSGSIEVDAVTGNATNLGFTVGTIYNNLKPHSAALESGNTENYAFSEGEQLIVVLNGDITNKTFTITMDLDGEVTTGDAGAPFETFIANIDATGQNFNLKFINDDDLKDFTVTFTSGANNGQTKSVTAYDASTGQFTCDAFPNAIAVGDDFYILPVTAKNVSTYFNNTITSTLSVDAITEPSSNGTKVQITSLEEGSSGQVNVTGGTANAILGFSTTTQTGIDAYQYYTGLLRTVQRTVDGFDPDSLTYPGVKAAGVQIEVLAPTVRQIEFIIDVDLAEGVSISTVVDDIRNKISSYVNGLGVGEDVVLTKIIDGIMDIEEITDVTITNPSANIAISDNEIARVVTDNIIVG